MKKLPKPIKEKWTAALRSKDFEQTRAGFLEQDGKYCCLGVLCKTQNIDHTGSGLYTILDDANPYVYDVLRGRIDNREIESKLVEMNDNDGKSFAEIADWIEDNL